MDSDTQSTGVGEQVMSGLLSPDVSGTHEQVTFQGSEVSGSDKWDNQGYTPLHHAVSRLQVQTVERLLAEGADPNVYSRNGILPLHCVFLDNIQNELAVKRALRRPTKGRPVSQIYISTKSRHRWRNLLCCCTGHALPENSHPWSTSGYEVDPSDLDEPETSTGSRDAVVKTADVTIVTTDVDAESDEMEDAEEDPCPSNDLDQANFNSMKRRGIKQKKVLAMLLKSGCDINALTRTRQHVTELSGFWTANMHPWILEHSLKLPDFDKLVESRAIPYSSQLRENITHYIRAGCRDKLAVQGQAALSVLSCNATLYKVVYLSAASVVTGMDYDFLFRSRTYDALCRLPDPVRGYIGFGYRICGDGGAWYDTDADLAPDNVYHVLQADKVTPLSLLLAATVTTRSILIDHSDGRSIFPAIASLPVPEKLKKLLKLDIVCERMSEDGRETRITF